MPLQPSYPAIQRISEMNYKVDISGLPPVTDKREEKLSELLTIVDYNKRDEGLWVKSDDIVVAYLQQALHKLHDVIEGEE